MDNLSRLVIAHRVLYLTNWTQHEPKRDSRPKPAIFQNAASALKVEHMGAVQLGKKNKLNFRSEQSEWKHLHGKDTYLVTESPVQQELLKEPLWNKSYTYHLHPVSGNPCSCRSHADMAGRSPHFWLLHRGVHKDGFYCKPALHTPE